MSDNSFLAYQLAELKQAQLMRDLQCPKCGGMSECVRGADFRYSKSGSPQIRQCLRCGHSFSYDDGCTG